jgi:uncharacterized protein (TIGR02996 family)
MESREALEAAIRARPADVQARLVLGDLLQQEGDLAGELVTLQYEMERDITKKMRADQFLEMNRGSLLRGLPKTGLKLEWFLGSVRKATFADVEPARVADALDHLPGLSVGRFVEELEIDGGNHPDLSPVYLALAQGAFNSLRRLELGGPGDFGPVWKALPALESLEIGGVGFGSVDAPRLRRLKLRGATADQLDALIGGGVSLHSLAFTANELDRGVWPALLSKQKELRELIVDGPAVCDWVCEDLARTCAGRRFERLSLRGGRMTIAGARALANAGFTADQLDVSNNALESTAKAVLMRVCPRLLFGRQAVDGEAKVTSIRRTAGGWVVLDKPNADPDLLMRAAAMLGKHHGLRTLILEVSPQVELAPGKSCTVVRLLGLGDKSFKLDEFAESLARRTESLRRADRYNVLCLHHVPHTSAAWRLFGLEGKLAEGVGAQAEVVFDGLQRLLASTPGADFLERLETAGTLRTVLWNHAPAPQRPVEGTRDGYQPLAAMDVDFSPPEAEPDGDQVIGECGDCRQQAELWECEDCREEFCGNCLEEPADRSAYVCRECAQGGHSGESYVEE